MVTSASYGRKACVLHRVLNEKPPRNGERLIVDPYRATPKNRSEFVPSGRRAYGNPGTRHCERDTDTSGRRKAFGSLIIRVHTGTRSSQCRPVSDPCP